MGNQREPAPHPNHSRRSTFLVIVGLLAACALVYGRTAGHEFVNFDDDAHIYENEYVRSGLSVRNVVWAFGIHGPSQWHPLAWISHQVDCELFGLNPGGHHLMNVVLHAVSAVFLFVALNRLSGAWGPSALVAALFAVHPLNVESVAWASERRNVLCAMFWMLALWAYVPYAGRGGWKRYLLVTVLFTLGLMSKPMIVTLPCVFLLLDYWPLKRLERKDECGRMKDEGRRMKDESGRTGLTKSILHPSVFILLEKLPWLALAAGAGVLTILCQESIGTVASFDKVPLDLRLANALVAYVAYLGKMVWPTGLAVFYPHPAIVDSNARVSLMIPAVIAGILLAAITAYAFYSARKRPYVIVGWLWYLGTLAPMIGVIQVGEQQMADRYTYVPQIGVFVAVVWLLRSLATQFARTPPRTVSEPLSPWERGRGEGTLVAVALVILMLLAWRQTGYWKNSILLFEHTAAVTGPNHWAHNNWGHALERKHNRYEAARHYAEAIRIMPNYAIAHYNLGVVLHDLGDHQAAISHLERAIGLQPSDKQAHVRLGAVLGQRGDLAAAAQHFRAALRIDPCYAIAHRNLGLVLERQGKLREAVSHFQQAIDCQPDFAGAQRDLLRTLAKLRRDAHREQRGNDPPADRRHYSP